MIFQKLTKNSNSEKQVIRPVIDTYETEANVVVRAEMPGVEKEALQVELKGEELIVSAPKLDKKLDSLYVPLYQERLRDVEYRRVFQLDSQVDRNNISASYEQGVLEIILAKSQEVQPKKVEISN